MPWVYLHRRHLTESQHALIVGKLATLKWGVNRRSDQEPTSALENPTFHKAAGLLNVGSVTVKAARTVLAPGCPALIRAVERGELAVSAARHLVSLTPREHLEILMATLWSQVFPGPAACWDIAFHYGSAGADSSAADLNLGGLHLDMQHWFR